MRRSKIRCRKLPFWATVFMEIVIAYAKRCANEAGNFSCRSLQPTQGVDSAGPDPQRKKTQTRGARTGGSIQSRTNHPAAGPKPAVERLLLESGQLSSDNYFSPSGDSYFSPVLGG